MQTYLKTKPVWIQLLLFLGMAFGLITVLGLAGMSMLSGMTGIDPTVNVARLDPNNPNVVFYFRGALLIQFIGFFLVPTLLFAYFSDPRPAQYLGLRPPFKAVYWILALLIMFVSIPLVEYIGILNQKISLGSATDKWMKGMEEEAQKQIEFMLHRHTVAELLKNLFFISVLAGIGEELFFRGVLQRLFIRAFRSPWAGIILTAAVFSAIHLQFYGFFPRLMLGILLGAVYWYSGSLWVSIAAHFVYDAFIIVLAYLKPEVVLQADKPMFQASALFLTALVSAVLTAILIWQMKKHSQARWQVVYADDKEPEKNPFSF